MNGDMLGWLENFVELFVGAVNYKEASRNVKSFKWDCAHSLPISLLPVFDRDHHNDQLLIYDPIKDPEGKCFCRPESFKRT